MPLSTIAEQEPFDAAAASASVKVQPEDAVTDAEVGGSLDAIADGIALSELVGSLEALAAAARDDTPLL